jgi:putative molybdopterin biosynthesis protein
LKPPAEIVAVSLSYDLRRATGAALAGDLFRVLGAIRREGSIAGAARALGGSYRHLWGYLKAQEQALGRELLRWDRGRAARLTDFAERLLWAETRIRARLAPQIENLQTEIGRELTAAFDDSVPIVSCNASHDPALKELQRLCAESSLLLDIHYEGSLQALASLRAGRCQFAAIRLPLGRPELAARGSGVHRAFGPMLRLGREKMIVVSQRQLGLIVAEGNPLGLRGVADVGRTRFVRRAAGSGSRLLLDELMRAEGATQPAAESALDESTHLALAAAVASGAADAGFGIEAAAQQFGLGFVPLVREHCFLVCDAADVDAAPASRLRETLASDAWRRSLSALAGYDAEGAGTVVSLRRTLPWYR